MLFRFEELDLKEKGITIERIDLVSTKDARYQSLLGRRASLEKYIDTLDLFRQRYLEDIKAQNIPAYKFDFTQMYVFKYKGRTFAATSPFTGFFAKADCDLKDASLSVTWSNKTHKLLTDTPAEWLGIFDRDPEFLKFLYILLKDNLGKIFRHLFKAVELSPSIQAYLAEYNDLTFEKVPEYRKFNVGKEPLPQIAGNTQNVSYIRPDGLDCSYLKYLLFLEEPVDLSISEDAYKLPIRNRMFPEKNGKQVSWIGVNDFLSDALIVLPYDINDNYHAATYIDIHTHKHHRCLLPLKRQALEYVDINTITDEELQIQMYSTNHYAVTLILPLTTGGKVELRRDYYGIDDEECVFPNGILYDMQNSNRHFAFGIYPFVRSANFENIYKVLFYNDFSWPAGYHPQVDDVLYDLKFLYFDNDYRAHEYGTNDVIYNQTNKADDEFYVNTHYYHVASSQKVVRPNWNGYVYIDFAELTLTLVKNPKSGNPQKIKASAIIVPKYHPVTPQPAGATVAIDLGTSNTFIAYLPDGKGANDIKEIKTIHENWDELTLMNKACTRNDRNDAVDKNRKDLYLRTNDNQEPDDYCLSAQLCEFIPTNIKGGNDADIHGYNFPIPTILNNLRVDGKNESIANGEPMVHYAIPFAYYDIGKRKDTQANRYDTITNGEFKWFYERDVHGLYAFNAIKQANFESFLKELLFIVRSHMLCMGYQLNQCKLIWTYPLSFDPNLVRFYKEKWNLLYCRYFNPGMIGANGQVNDPMNQLPTLVRYTNESRSPIYECVTNPNTAHHLTLLMDIGGGSTDVIGYYQNQPQFVTSFGFAGNALYLDGSLNSKMNADSLRGNYNYIRKRIRDLTLLPNNANLGTVKVGYDSPINTLMNYGFSQVNNFDVIFNDLPVQFMLQLHNAAIFYQTAQLCKIKRPDEIPDKVYLTGNGSRLFGSNHNPGMIDAIFKQVYENNGGQVDTVCQGNPKAATAYGSLKGSLSNLQFNAASQSSQLVMLGDAETVFNKNPLMPVNVAPDQIENYQKSIYDNVVAFINMFFDSIYSYRQNPCFSKKEVLDALAYIKGSSMLNLNATLTDSMFFQYISLLMEELSVRMIDSKRI